MIHGQIRNQTDHNRIGVRQYGNATGEGLLLYLQESRSQALVSISSTFREWISRFLGLINLGISAFVETMSPKYHSKVYFCMGDN